MKTATVVAAAAGLVAAQFSYNATTGQYTCAQPNQAYCLGDPMKTNIILRCDKDADGQPGNCNDNLAGEPPTGNTFSPCWQTSNTTGDAACSKNCVVYGGSGNYNGTFTLPAKDCTPTYTATSSSATIATTLTQSVTVSSVSNSASSDSDPISGTATTTVCTEGESSTASTGAVTGSSPPSVTTSATSATTVMPPPASSNNPSGEGSPPPAGSTATEPSISGPGPVVTSTPTSTSSVAAVSTTSFPTAGAAANHVGVGLGVIGLLVGAMI